MTRAEAMLHRLACGIKASAKIVAVIAHPDDEAVGFGGAMTLMQDVTVLQVTDGSVNIPRIWAGVGADSPKSYATVRGMERERAWTLAGWEHPLRELCVPDRQAHEQVAAIIDVLMLMLPGADAVFTHPYEGGHPDHDACAFAVQTACDRLGARAPERVEFASYHWNKRRVFGQFYPDAKHPAIWANVIGKPLRAKQKAIAAYASQRQILRWFPVERECYRIAPRYDFTQPPPPPDCLYDRRKLPVTSAEWRAAVARAA